LVEKDEKRERERNERWWCEGGRDIRVVEGAGENEGDEGIEAWLWRPARRKGNTL